jgi:hypothetical protein
MGVLTSADFFGIEKKEEKKPEEITRAISFVKGKFVFENALPGKSRLAFIYKKMEYCVSLEDGIFSAPEGEEWDTILLESGFKRCIQGPEVGNEIPTVDEEKKIEQKYDNPFVLYHPDHTEQNIINAKIEIQVGKKRIPLRIVDGRIETTDIQVKKALLKMGYRSGEAAEMGEDE